MLGAYKTTVPPAPEMGADGEGEAGGSTNNSSSSSSRRGSSSSSSSSSSSRRGSSSSSSSTSSPRFSIPSLASLIGSATRKTKEGENAGAGPSPSPPSPLPMMNGGDEEGRGSLHKARIKELEDENEALHADLFSEKVTSKKQVRRISELESRIAELEVSLADAEFALLAAREEARGAVEAAARAEASSQKTKEPDEAKEASLRHDMRISRTWALHQKDLDAKLEALRRRVDAVDA